MLDQVLQNLPKEKIWGFPRQDFKHLACPSCHPINSVIKAVKVRIISKSTLYQTVGDNYPADLKQHVCARVQKLWNENFFGCRPTAGRCNIRHELNTRHIIQHPLTVALLYMNNSSDPLRNKFLFALNLRIHRRLTEKPRKQFGKYFLRQEHWNISFHLIFNILLKFAEKSSKRFQ